MSAKEDLYIKAAAIDKAEQNKPLDIYCPGYSHDWNLGDDPYRYVKW